MLRGLLILELLTLLPIAAARAEVTVYPQRGAPLVGHVDRLTSSTHLWLRTEVATSSLRRAIRWERVSMVLVRGRQMSGDQFRPLAQTLATRASSESSQPELSQPDWLRPTSTASGARPSTVRSTAERARQALRGGKATEVRVTCRIENAPSDSGALIVHVHAVDQQGRAVAIQGALEVMLPDLNPADDEETSATPRVPRWYRHFDLSDHDPLGMTFRLPLEKFQLEPAPRNAVLRIKTKVVLSDQRVFTQAGTARVIPSWCN